MGLAALSDRLADRLVPGIRSRMLRIRFITAMAVGALAVQDLWDEPPSDGKTTPAIAFEWLVIEAFVRRIPPNPIPPGIPGTQKARAVTSKGQRLSAPTYLKSPSVFGFNGIYKPFAVDAGAVSGELLPAARSIELVQAWEQEQGLEGFAAAISGTAGGRVRGQIATAVRTALRTGRCSEGVGNHIFGLLARSLVPNDAGRQERRVLRSLIMSGDHELRAELAQIVEPLDGDEATVLRHARPKCSKALGTVVDAVIAYEELAACIDRAFRTLCEASHSLGTQPLTPALAAGLPAVKSAAGELPRLFERAQERLAPIGPDLAPDLVSRLGDLAVRQPADDLARSLFDHHQKVQENKLPSGKRPWFEPYKDGYVVRAPYARPAPPDGTGAFVHPVRVAALRRFMVESAP